MVLVHSVMSEAKGVMWKGEPVSSIQLPQSPNRRCRSSCDAVSDLEALASRAEVGVAEPMEGGKAGAAVPIQLPDDDPTDARGRTRRDGGVVSHQREVGCGVGGGVEAIDAAGGDDAEVDQATQNTRPTRQPNRGTRLRVRQGPGGRLERVEGHQECRRQADEQGVETSATSPDDQQVGGDNGREVNRVVAPLLTPPGHKAEASGEHAERSDDDA